MISQDLRIGAQNLLFNCARLQPGETVLIVHEDPKLGWYDQDVCDALEFELSDIGIKPSIMSVGAPGGGDGAKAKTAVAEFDCTIFLARIGDQDRFDEPIPGHRTVMVYARTADALASGFGTTDHNAMLAVKQSVNTTMNAADKIEISCPMGTNLIGHPQKTDTADLADVSVMRFPMGVPAPILAESFSGKVALTGFLTPTGSQAYDPPSIPIDDIVFATIESGRIVGFEGDDDQVAAIEAHYQLVADKFGIDKYAIHSWHAGIHPACGYQRDIAENPDRWSNSVFPNPRYAHFHTCGDYAPGEICWMVLDPTISLDGKPLWENGKLDFEQLAENSVRGNFREMLTPIFDNPNRSVGR